MSRSVIVGVALVVSLIGNLALGWMYVKQKSATATPEAFDVLEASDTTHREQRDILAQLIPAVTSEVGVADLEAYLGSVYSGEIIGIAEDPKCIGCVVLSWRAFRFAFDANGRLSKVDSAS